MNQSYIIGTIARDHDFVAELVPAPPPANPYLTMTRDQLAEQIELLAAAIATSPTLNGTDKLHAITEAEMELADARIRVVVDLHRNQWQYWSWARIGDALGITRQGARQKYAPHVERAQLSDQVRQDMEASA